MEINHISICNHRILWNIQIIVHTEKVAYPNFNSKYNGYTILIYAFFLFINNVKLNNIWIY